MARITVEDCLRNLDNRFNLVLLASRRARQLASGHEPQVPWKNDKPTVVALREIAAGAVNLDTLRNTKEPRRAKSTTPSPDALVPSDVPMRLDD